MKRISTDKEYLVDGRVVVDADGVPVDITPKPVVPPPPELRGNFPEALPSTLLKNSSFNSRSLTAKSGGEGKWILNENSAKHGMEGLHLMVMEASGTNPPALNIRGDDYGTYGVTITPPDTPRIQHIWITKNLQIIFVGRGEGSGKTTVTFIKLGDLT